MIVTRSMHPDWRSNAYLLADEPGGHAVFVDAGAPVEPLMSRAEELGVRVTHVLLTHEHHDHTTHVVPLEERYGARLVSPEMALEVDGPVTSGKLSLRALSTPGHCEPHVAWLVEEDGEVVAAFTGDVLFRETVGGTLNGGPQGCARLVESVESLLSLPPDTVLYPGHMEETTVAHERARNPFVLAWHGEREPGAERVHVAGTDATLLLEGADYDGGTKAWVRFDDGNEAVVGGSMVSRAGARA